MMRNVYFEGDLGDTFVPHIYMECETPSEAFKCLRGNFPEKFSEYMIDKCEKGVAFHIEVAKEERYKSFKRWSLRLPTGRCA